MVQQQSSAQAPNPAIASTQASNVPPICRQSALICAPAPVQARTLPASMATASIQTNPSIAHINKDYQHFISPISKDVSCHEARSSTTQVNNQDQNKMPNILKRSLASDTMPKTVTAKFSSVTPLITRNVPTPITSKPSEQIKDEVSVIDDDQIITPRMMTLSSPTPFQDDTIVEIQSNSKVKTKGTHQQTSTSVDVPKHAPFDQAQPQQKHVALPQVQRTQIIMDPHMAINSQQILPSQQTINSLQENIDPQIITSQQGLTSQPRNSQQLQQPQTMTSQQSLNPQTLTSQTGFNSQQTLNPSQNLNSQQSIPIGAISVTLINGQPMYTLQVDGHQIPIAVPQQIGASLQVPVSSAVMPTAHLNVPNLQQETVQDAPTSGNMSDAESGSTVGSVGQSSPASSSAPSPTSSK